MDCHGLSYANGYNCMCLMAFPIASIPRRSVSFPVSGNQAKSYRLIFESLHHSGEGEELTDVWRIVMSAVVELESSCITQVEVVHFTHQHISWKKVKVGWMNMTLRCSRSAFRVSQEAGHMIFSVFTPIDSTFGDYGSCHSRRHFTGFFPGSSLTLWTGLDITWIKQQQRDLRL
ncbi:hypothetical protein F2P79_002673 [Pimephales promelas]|nr:hypothetical protein F2P79_002673 [Pimephales promelas]